MGKRKRKSGKNKCIGNRKQCCINCGISFWSNDRYKESKDRADIFPVYKKGLCSDKCYNEYYETRV